jgi:glycosyltransferase involved in cell wall biosynthesis
MACEKAVLVVCSAGLAHSLISTDGSSTRAREWTFPTDAMQSVVDSSPLADQPLNLADTARLIIYTGNFAAYQGIDLLLSALPLVAAQCADAVFVLVGADSKSLRRLSARHAEEIRQGRLIVLARQSRARTLKLLQKADVAVSPRVSGTNLPLKVFDYLVAGLPVVATHIAAHRPLEGKGLLLTEATPAGLAGGIVDLLKDRSLMERYGARARAVADTELGWPLFRTQVAAIYHDALEQIRTRTV